MQPADIRIDPWTWIPAAKRSGARALGILILAVSCTAAGILIGRLTVGRSDVAEAPRQTSSAVPTAKAPTSPQSQGGSVTQKSPPQPSLAIKGSPESTEQSRPKQASEAEPKQQTPPVVLLNPGTADPNARARAPREASDDRSRFREDPARRRDDVGDRERPNSAARDYRALRDYMLGR